MRLNELLVWLYRWRHCRGFGVQSPTDYNFIRYVINEHYPYYAYQELREMIPMMDRMVRKKAELMFRIANRLQPEYVYFPAYDECYLPYISAGCHRCKFVDNVMFDFPESISEYGFGEICWNNMNILIFDSVNYAEIAAFLPYLKDNTLIVVDNINCNSMKECWIMLCSERRITITYDLHYLGLAFISPGRHKQHYNVNF